MEIEDSEGLLPIHYASQRVDKKKNIEVVNFLVAEGERRKQTAAAASPSGRIKGVGKVLDVMKSWTRTKNRRKSMKRLSDYMF